MITVNQYALMDALKKISDTIEIWFWEISIKILERVYGKGCPDYYEPCVECRCKKVVDFIKEHIELIKFFR